MAGLELLLLGAGLGRGYKQHQETQRALAEARRKALMEQREMELRESEIESQNLLRSAQAGFQEAEGEYTRGKGQRETEASSRVSAPITGTPPAWWPPGVPYTPENVDRLSDLGVAETSGRFGLRRQELENIGRLSALQKENEFRINNPQAYGGRRSPKTVTELIADIMSDLAGGQPGMLESPEQFVTRKQGIIDMLYANRGKLEDLFKEATRADSLRSDSPLRPQTGGLDRIPSTRGR